MPPINESIKKYAHNAKAVDQFDLNGQYIATYPCLLDAANALDIHSSGISIVLDKDGSAGGYRWKTSSNLAYEVVKKSEYIHEYTKQDELEFLRLMNNHKGLIYKAMHGHSFIKSSDEWDDYLQEIYLYAWRRFYKYEYRAQCDFGPWIWQTCLWAIRKYRRGQKETSDLLRYVDVSSYLFDISLEEYEGEDDIASLYRAVKDLTDQEQEVIKLLLEGNTLDQVAEGLGISRAVVCHRYDHLKEKIRKHYRRYWPDKIPPSKKFEDKGRSHLSKPVLQIDLNGNPVRSWPSITETQKGGFHYKGVQDVLKGRTNHYMGYFWRYESQQAS